MFKTWIPAFAGMTILIGAVALPVQALEKYVTASGEVIDALPQVIVKFKPGRSGAARSGMLKNMGVPRMSDVTDIGANVLSLPPGRSLQSFVDQLKKNPDVEYAEPNGVLRKLDTPNDPDFPSQYYLNANTTNMQAAWDITTGSNTVIIAVIDTGADLDHEDLENSYWDNPSPSGVSGAHGTQLGVDWNNDGDFVDTDPTFGVEQAPSGTPEDDNTGEYHGTRVSGIIAAQTNNNTDMAGVCRNCKIMVIKALTADGNGDFVAVSSGVLYAVNNGASVINMSLGGSSSSNMLSDAIAYANDNNVVVVAASGNDAGPVNFPARIASVIAVGATDSSNTLATFSSTGDTLDLVAPGVGILSTITADATDAGAGSSGTSFSAPIVAGVAGLIRSIAPTMSVADVTRYIDFTATDLGESGPDNSYGHGLLNGYRAVFAAQTGQVISARSSSGQTYPYPNPFNPLEQGTVSIALPSSLGTDGLEIKIFNVAGELVKTLHSLSWDGKNDDGSIVAPGMYFYFAKTSSGDVKGKLAIRL